MKNSYAEARQPSHHDTKESKLIKDESEMASSSDHAVKSEIEGEDDEMEDVDDE